MLDGALDMDGDAPGLIKTERRIAEDPPIRSSGAAQAGPERVTGVLAALCTLQPCLKEAACIAPELQS
jgi:hypothetical protein